MKEAKELSSDIPDVDDESAQLDLKNAAGDVSEAIPFRDMSDRCLIGRHRRQQAHRGRQREARHLEGEEGAWKDHQQGHLDEQ